MKKPSLPKLCPAPARTSSFRLLVVLVASLFLGHAKADLVSPYGGETAPNFAELQVLEDRVRVVLEIDRADFPHFVANDGETGASLAARTGQTFGVAADGKAISPTSRTVDLRPRKDRRTTGTPLVAPLPRSADVIYAELDYPFQGKPAVITFTPPLDRDGGPLASIGFLAEHMGVPVTDFRYLSRPETMVVDWEDPWFTTFENPNLTRHHRSPLMSFISVEPREVRHEIILRLSDLEGLAPVGLPAGDTVGPQEMERVSEVAEDFLRQRNPFTINAVTAAPRNVQVSRLSVGATGLQVLHEETISARRTTLLGVILHYPQEKLADTVQLRWDLFPEGIDAVPVTLIDPAGGVPAEARRGDPVVEWTNHLKTWRPRKTRPVEFAASSAVGVPLLSGGLFVVTALLVFLAFRAPYRRPMITGACLALVLSALASPVTSELRLPWAPTLDVHSASAPLSGLIENANTALLETERRGFDTALQTFVAADARSAVGAEILRGLSAHLPSGARGRAENIADLTIEEIGPRLPDGGYPLLARWRVTATGGHWGHQHRRQITYRALAELTPRNGAWMLSGLTVLRAD